MCSSCAQGCQAECGEAREDEEDEGDVEGGVSIIMRKYDLEHMHAVQYTIYCVVNCDSAHTVLLLPCDSFPYMPLHTHVP